MQANRSAALRARPFLFFFSHKLIGATGLDPYPVFDQADVIPLPVSFVHLLDRRAGKR